MTEYPKRKGDITRLVLEIIQPDYSLDDYKVAMSMWWRDIRPTGGLGLSKDGHNAFMQAQLEYWDIPVNLANIGTPESMLRIVRGVHCPHYHIFLEMAKVRYFKKPTIRIFDSKIASLMILHGSFQSYLESVENSRNGVTVRPGSQRIDC